MWQGIADGMRLTEVLVLISELLKTKASWMDAAEEQRQQAMRETLAQPKAELVSLCCFSCSI